MSQMQVDAAMKPATDADGEPIVYGEHRGFEVYPMPFFVTLTVEDPAAVAAWYESALGFSKMFVGPLIHLRRRKYQDILLVQGQASEPGACVKLVFQAQGDVVDLAERAREVEQLGRSAVADVVKTPWNAIELNVTDPTGNHLVFTERDSDPDPENMKRWQEMFERDRQQGAEG